MIWDSGLNGYSGGGGQAADKAFPKSTGSDLPKDKWTHVALTCQKTASGKIAYEAFVEGDSKGIIEEPYAQASSPSPSFFVLGGRPHAANSFMGNISSLRLSSRVLAPNEFLCAASTAQPTTTQTIAYWSLDFDGTSVDLTSRVPTAVVSNESVGVVGSTRRAFNRVPNPDKSEDFIGNRQANAGSISLSGADGHFSCGVGLQADVDASFTAEGWVKAALADNANAASVICGTYDLEEARGWKLVLDTAGEKPCVRLKASAGVAYTGFVDDVMVEDASGWDGAWKRLALTYDVHAGSRGVWTLFVDGKAVKSVENRWSPQSVLCNAEFFCLGARSSADRSLSGSYDVWRLSRGVLTPSEFLGYSVPRGLLLFVR